MFKTPDSVWNSVEECGFDPNDLPEDVQDVIEKFILYSECVMIELDSETQEATVVPI